MQVWTRWGKDVAWAPVDFLSCPPPFCWYNKTTGGSCWQEIWHHSATQHNQSLFPLQQQQQQQSLRHLLTFLSNQGIMWCLSMMIALISQQASFCERVFLIHQPHCVREPLFWGLTCIKTRVLLPRLSSIHKHNSSTGVGGNIFSLSLSQSLQKDVVECVG